MSYQELIIPGQVDEKFMSHALSPQHLGTLPNADGCATLVGQCGDSVEVYLKVADGELADIRVFPHGCVYTVVCASALSCLALGRGLDEVLELGPEDVENEVGGLPEDHRHCARLAVNTLGEAVADYWQKVRAQKEA